MQQTDAVQASRDAEPEDAGICHFLSFYALGVWRMALRIFPALQCFDNLAKTLRFFGRVETIEIGEAGDQSI